MDYKKELAKNLIKEVEINGFQYIFGDEEWETLKKDLIFSATTEMLSTNFWDNVKYISKEVGDFTRR